MKSFIVLAIIVAALFCGQRSCTPLNAHTAAQPQTRGEISESNGARQWQQAPSAMMDMQDAMGGASGGPARAARDAITQQLGR